MKLTRVQIEIAAKYLTLANMTTIKLNDLPKTVEDTRFLFTKWVHKSGEKEMLDAYHDFQQELKSDNEFMVETIKNICNWVLDIEFDPKFITLILPKGHELIVRLSSQDEFDEFRKQITTLEDWMDEL